MARPAPIHPKEKCFSLSRCRRPPREQGAYFHLPGQTHWQGRWCGEVHDAATALEQLAPADLFLQAPFLHLLEAHPPGLRGGLLLLYYRGRLTGAGYCQFLSFDAGRQIRLAPGEQPRWPALRDAVARRLRFEVLVLGQFLVSGPHALARWRDQRSWGSQSATPAISAAAGSVSCCGQVAAPKA